jgi:hypothetical protein
MFRKLRQGVGRRGIALGATLLAAATLAMAADGVDDALAGWVGREFTIHSSNINESIPVGGKLTFIYDSDEDVVRVCTRMGPNQRLEWRSDFASPCSVTLTFTRGQRYCTVEDVNAGNAEVLSACHRLRSREVSMQPKTTRGAVELQDMLVFLVESAPGSTSKHTISILVDSPARVTADGNALGTD